MSGQERDHPAEFVRYEKTLAWITSQLANVPEKQFDSALTQCLRELVESLDVDRCTVVLFSDRGKILTATHSWARDGIRRVVIGTKIEAKLVWYTHQIRLGHIAQMSSASELPDGAVCERAYVEEVGLKSMISIPMIVEDTVIGALAFETFQSERQWPPEFVWRLRLAGQIVGLAILSHKYAATLTNLVQTASQASPAGMGAALGPESRRRRAVDLIQIEHQELLKMSNILHEDVMQMLVAVQLFIERLRAADADERPAIIAHSGRLLQDILKKLRRLAIQLRSDRPPETGLVEELRWLAGQMEETLGLSVEFHADDAVEPVKEDAQLFLCSAARRLLDSIAAHPESKRVKMEISRIDEERVRLEISNDGPVPIVSALDLFSIREETKLFGGNLEVERSSGNPERVTIEIPG